MKDSTKNIIKAIAIALAFALIISSIFIIRSCSAPPEYEEIRSRVEELIKASFDVNDVVWGDGLPTYERVTSPKREFYESGKTYLDADGNEQPLNYYYYYLNVSDARLVAFRKQKDLKADFVYGYITNAPADSSVISALFPLDKGQEATEGLYSEIYSDSATSTYIYLVPYTEPVYDFYYISTDPEDYDYVVTDSKYASIDAIKGYVRTVYSSDYADSLDSILFDGVAEGQLVDKARYSVISGSRGSLLASLNTFEPLFTERRVYLYNTAKIDRANSNDTTVVVEFESYLPSEPNKLVPTKVSFVLQDGVWYLASPTY